MARTKLLSDDLTSEQRVVAEYLDANASDELVNKINSGDKYMKDCWDFIYKQAEALAKGQKCLCVTNEVVFGWAFHYFEEDSIKKGATVSVPKAKVRNPKENIQKKKPETKPEKPKEKKDDMLPGQMTIFDLMGV